MAQKYMTTVDVREAVRMYEAGMSLKAISQTLGFCRRTITNHLAKQCSIRSSAKQNALQRGPLTEAQEREAVRLYRRGVSKRQLAERFNKYLQYFNEILRRHGVAMRHRNAKENYPHCAKPEHLAMTLLVTKLHRDEELSIGEISELVGKSFTAVRDRLFRSGAIRSKGDGARVKKVWNRKPASEREARIHRARKLIENYRREYGAL